MSESHQPFATTRWTLVWQAAVEDSSLGRPAVEELIRKYWQPLYGFARRRGLSREDAEDATQEFLSDVLRGNLLEKVDPAKGKFRAFLLVAWKRFLIDDFRKRHSARRGGDVQLLSLDFANGEDRWLDLESREADPDRFYLISWANSLLEIVRDRLRESYASRDRSQVLDLLLPRITESLSKEQYDQLANELGLSPSAIKVAMHRLRQRFGETLREVVSETVDDATEIDREIVELTEALAGHQGQLPPTMILQRPE